MWRELISAGPVKKRNTLFSFFFSSRRRHTRCGRDWSSDVCSSDLNKPLVERVVTITGDHVAKPSNILSRIGTPLINLIEVAGGLPEETSKIVSGGPRSEERRVGKEWRYANSPEQGIDDGTGPGRVD